MRENRGIELRTLAIASVASAAAALITSQFWIRGTPIAAALTPIIVTLVSELLHRPTEKIAARMTVETDALPEAAGAQPPPRSEEIAPRPAPDPDFKVYRSGSARRKRIAWATVLTTGLLAFVIAAVVLTVPELLAGGSIGGRDRATTLVPSKKQAKDDGGSQSDPADEETATDERTVTETVPSEPETVTETTPSQPQQRTTPTTPQAAPRQQSTPPPTTTTPTTPTTTAP
jgi:uncharacterized membrane protein YvlD (DUF360 family)